MAKYEPERAERALRFAAFPGITLREACERFGITRYALDKAARELGRSARPSERDLVLAAVTRYGDEREGELGDLATLASYLDYVEKSGATVADVQRYLRELADLGVLELDGNRYRLLIDFP